MNVKEKTEILDCKETISKYAIQIVETLAMDITVLANNEQEAIRKAKKAYYKEAIILDSSNFVDVEFAIVEKKMKTQIEKDIAKLQTKLIKKVKENGIYENFGEKEQRQIADKYDFYKDKNAHKHYMNFVDWCQNYNG